jgi:hypothetical protein
MMIGEKVILPSERSTVMLDPSSRYHLNVS